jgi:hypothetical protein
LHDLVAIEPGAREKRATAAKQDNNYDTDDESSIALLGGFGTNRHFVHFTHDFFSFVMRLDKKTSFDE